MIDKKDTIAAIATPSGRGGIGVIRISGPLATDICTSMTGIKPVARQANYCNFKNTDGATLDRGLVLYFSAPASYTGEDVVELQGHGGLAILDILLKEVLELGARQARPGEFTERAFLNEKIDLLQAEAIADLIESTSEQAARSAMRSLDGEFSDKINLLLKDMIAIRVFVEGALDFPEEEIDFLGGSDVRERVDNCLSQLDSILSKARNGKILREGISMAIVGPPNVGKSSLLNALSQTNRAIVTPTPGTTRDIIEEKILLDGLHLSIIDTAGIRETNNSIEQEGIRRAQLAAEKADLLIVMLQAEDEKKQRNNQIEISFSDNSKRITVYNKIDLLNKKIQAGLCAGSKPGVFLSVKTGAGMDVLIERIKQEAGLVNTGEDVLSARTRHIDALSRARATLRKVYKELDKNKLAAELVAEDLQQAQRELESITGKSTPDDLLGQIFANFCIGK
jgi:tRNA modification GTPase